MANSYSLTTATAGQNTVPVPFDKISRLHVFLEINGVLTSFVWNSESTLGLLTPLVGGERVFVYRTTPDVTPVVTYTPGTITSKNLNDQTEQLLFVVQEARDEAEASISIDFGTNTFDALGLRVGNIATPVNVGDAVTKAYADAIITQAQSVVTSGEASINSLVSTATTNLNGIVSTATTNLNGIVSSADATFQGYLTQIDADATQTAADRVATGQDRVATGADRVAAAASATAADASATAVYLAAEKVGRVSMANGPVDPGHIRWYEGGTFDRAAYPDLAAYMDLYGAEAFGLTPSEIAAGTIPDRRDYSPRTAGGALGPAVGAKQEDAFQGHEHTTDVNGRLSASISNAVSGGAQYTLVSVPDQKTIGAVTDGVNGAPRTATETRVKSFGVRWQIKAYGAIVNQGTADLVAIEQHYQTLANGALRKDVDQSAGYGVPEKVTILKNVLQAWEKVGQTVTATNITSCEWINLDYHRVRITGGVRAINSGVNMRMRFKQLNGGWLSGANTYERIIHGLYSTNNLMASDTSDSLGMNGFKALPNTIPMMFEITLIGLNDPIVRTQAFFRARFFSDTGWVYVTSANGFNQSMQHDGIQITTDLGNLDAYNILVEGSRA